MDVTMQVIEAQEARSRMQEAKKRIKAEVRRKYESRIAEEVAERTQDAEIEFAKTLARVHASGVSQATLRRDVLRTNVWSVWTYWRDLADIEPERVTARVEREEANRPYRFEKFTYRGTERDAILWLKDKKGKTLDTPLRAYVVWDFLDFPDLDRDQEDYRKSVGYGFEEFTRLTGAIIKEHYEGKEQGE